MSHRILKGLCDGEEHSGHAQLQSMTPTLSFNELMGAYVERARRLAQLYLTFISTSRPVLPLAHDGRLAYLVGLGNEPVHYELVCHEQVCLKKDQGRETNSQVHGLRQWQFTTECRIVTPKKLLLEVSWRGATLEYKDPIQVPRHHVPHNEVNRQLPKVAALLIKPVSGSSTASYRINHSVFTNIIVEQPRLFSIPQIYVASLI